MVGRFIRFIRTRIRTRKGKPYNIEAIRNRQLRGTVLPVRETVQRSTPDVLEAKRYIRFWTLGPLVTRKSTTTAGRCHSKVTRNRIRDKPRALAPSSSNLHRRSQT